MRAGVGAVVATKYIGGKGTNLFTTAAFLRGFVLSWIEVEEIFVSSSHQRL